MKESIKKKFDSIDQSKIKVESTKELLAKIEKALNGKSEENADKAEALLDKFISQAKAKNADIFVSKKAEPTLTPTEKKKANQAVKSKLETLMDTINNDPLLKDFNNARRSKGGGKSDPLIDSERKARESGIRISKKGWKNQYGKSAGGRKYYEYRENRIDRKAPNYGNRPWLEDGGFIHPSDANADKFVVVEIKEDGSRREHNNFGDFETAMMFASLKREFLPKGSQLIIEDKNGKNLYRSFKSGGQVDESTAMVLSQNKAIAHHTEELKKALEKNKSVEPWVVGKIERASTDISDVTHYLDGKTEYAKGGYMADGGLTKDSIKRTLVEDKNQYFLQKDGNGYILYITPSGATKSTFHEKFKVEDLGTEGGRMKYRLTKKDAMMADGGEIERSATRKAENANYTNEELTKDYNDAKFNLSEFRSGNLKPSKVIGGGYKSSSVAKRLAEEYLESQVEIYKKALIKRGMMADGGKVRWQDVYVGDNALVIAENKMGVVIKPYGRRFHLRFPDGSEKTYSAEELEFFKDDEFAKGGKTSTGKYVDKRNVHNIVIKNPNKNGAKNYLSINSKDFLNGLHEYAKGGKLTDDYKYIKRGDVEHVVYRDSNGKDQLDFKPKNGYWVSKKALVDAGMNETKAKFDADEVANEIIKLSNKAWDTLSIQSGSEIYASDSLQEKLADEYYKLGIDKIYKKLTKPERKKVSDILTDENEHSLRNYLALRGFNGEAEYKNYVEMYEDTYSKYGYRSNWNPKNVDVSLGVVSGSYAKGGDIGFEKLSNKVAKSYVGDKVKPKYQKEYGKTYDKAEAKEVGDKVAAKVYRQQLAKMAKGGKLAEDLDRYFTKTRTTKIVKISDLIPLRARPTGIENAHKYMKMAYDGEMAKRKPITIYKAGKGKYRVQDGNSTFAVAKANGWENIYADVVKNPNYSSSRMKTGGLFLKAKEIRKAGEPWQDAVKRAKTMM